MLVSKRYKKRGSCLLKRYPPRVGTARLAAIGAQSSSTATIASDRKVKKERHKAKVLGPKGIKIL